MPEGTLFPSLDGSTPGDNPNVGQDITDTPLPDLFDGTSVGQPSVTPNPGPGAIEPFAPPAPQNPAQNVDPTLADVGDTVRRSGVQSRFDKLTRRIHEGRAREMEQANQIAALTNQLSELNARISSLPASRAPATPAPYGSSSDPLSGAGGDAVPRGGGLDEASIARVIDERLAPLANQLQSNQRLAALRAAQEESFGSAAEEWPELRKADSEFRQEFNRLFDNSPLKTLPDGPMQVAAQVRGILADRRREQQIVSERKRAAGVTTPSPQAVEPAAEADGLPKDVAAQYATAKERMRTGTASVQDQMFVVKVNRFKNARKVGI